MIGAEVVSEKVGSTHLGQNFPIRHKSRAPNLGWLQFPGVDHTAPEKYKVGSAMLATSY